MSSTERLLRQYVRALLKEEGDHAGYTPHDIMMSAGGMSPYGMHYGSSSDMYNTFIKPFVDVAQTTAGKTKELSQKAQTLTKVAFETIATTLIPILRDDYKEIFDNEKKAMQKIRQEYAAVYKSNWDALLNDDIMVAAFFYNPAAFFTVHLARKMPNILLNLTSILTGGEIDNWVDKVRTKVKGGGEKKDRHGRKETINPFGGYKRGDKTHLPSGGPGYGVDYYGEGVLREDEGQTPDVAKLLTSEKLKSRIQQSPMVQKMQASAQGVVRGTLEQVFKQAQGVMSANSLQDLQNKTGAKLKGLDKLRQIPQQERQGVEQSILSSTKKSMKEFYVKNLEAQVKKAVDAGVPEDSGYVQDYARVIAKIKAL